MTPRPLKTILITLCFFLITNGVLSFESTRGAFRIDMPGVPTSEVVRHKSIIGAVLENTYSFKTKTGEYTVSYTPLPKAALLFKSDASLLKSAQKGFLKETGATLLRVRKVDVSGHAGSEMDFEIPKTSALWKGTARFLLAQDILYVVMAASDGPEADRKCFLDSFALLLQ